MTGRSAVQGLECQNATKRGRCYPSTGHRLKGNRNCNNHANPQKHNMSFHSICIMPNTVGIRIVKIGITETFEYQTISSLLFKWFGIQTTI